MLIKRHIYSKIQAHLESKEITILAGPRQAGKTTLVQSIFDELVKDGQKAIFLNLDKENDFSLLQSQDSLIEKLNIEFGKDKAFVFIDEIQKKENAGIFLKGIYDMNLPYKFIVTGSGSLELKEKIHESLAGRKRIFELNTVNFSEFVNFKTDYKYENRLSEFLRIDPRSEILLREYLRFGGYPSVVLAETRLEKHKVLSEIYESYLLRDISDLLGVKNRNSFSDLVKILANQTGSLINISELSNTVDLSVQTVKDYLWYLEKTFLINKITPFYRNKRKEITKSPAVYFKDLGMRNFVNDTLLGDTLQNDGFLFQNFIFNILKDQISSVDTIHFYRSKMGSEVDFILGSPLNIKAVEVKYTSLDEPKMTRSLRGFIEKYKIQSAEIINLTLNAKINVGGCEVSFIPYFNLINYFVR